MNQQELYDLGYRVTTSPWSISVRCPVRGRGTDRIVVVRVDGESHSEKLRRGWEAALVHYTKRRLDGDSV